MSKLLERLKTRLKLNPPKEDYQLLKLMRDCAKALDLHEKLIDRFQPICEDLHHEPKEHHDSFTECPVIKKFKSILPEELL